MGMCALYTLGLILAAGLSLSWSAPSVDEYMRAREEVLAAEEQYFLGGSSLLTLKEGIVNDILMAHKEKEYTQALDLHGEFFPSTKHIYHSMKLIEASNVFKIIRLMPKAGGLHMHDLTIAPTDVFVKNISTWDNLYYCEGDGDHLLFRFFPTDPVNPCAVNSYWAPMRSFREKASSPEWVDEFLFANMNMMTPTPEVDYKDTNMAWNWFEKKITTISGMADFEPALRAYYYHTLKAHHEDNVMYLEMRGLLSGAYYLNQTELSNMETLRVFKETTDQFVQDYPDFFGAKYIYAPHRFNSPADIGRMMTDSIEMKAMFPTYFAGFDLVGQEDKGSPLLAFLPELLLATEQGVKFFFHAGETNWRGTKIDENLFDAVLLNTTRIGHGYALFSHPYLYDKAKQNKIAIEVCPISNQILGLVKDVRNHPAFNYMREDFPIVVASDGAGIYGMTPLSHDFYIAFMSMGGKRADLRFLKKLALNSIEYSAMTVQEKVNATALWEAKWDIFLDEVLNQFSNQKHDLLENDIIDSN